MRKIYYNEGTRVNLGMQSENESRCAVFEVEDGFEDYQVQLVFRRRPTENPYVVSKVSVQNGEIEWTLTETDTEMAGFGKLQIVYSKNGSVGKSVVISTLISESLGSVSSAPTPSQSWITSMLAASASATNAKTAAETAQANAEESEDNAATYAGNASASATSASEYASAAEEALEEVIEATGYIVASDDEANSYLDS